MTSVSRLQSGDIVYLKVGDDYKKISIGDLIGKGKTARVFKANDGFSDLICLKLYKAGKQPASLPALIDAVQRRAKMADGDRRPSVAYIRGSLHPHPECPPCGVAVEYLPGPPYVDLARFVSSRAASLEMRLRAATNLATVVGELHERGFVVGDLSPTNTFVRDPGSICLLDADSFGVLDPETGTALIQAKYTTPKYTAPETDPTPPDVASDCYVLAVVILELLLRRHPFLGIAPGTGGDGGAQANMNSGVSWLFDSAVRIPEQVRGTGGLNALPDPIARLTSRALQAPIDQRPAPSEWSDALGRARLGLGRCPTCASARFGTSAVCMECGSTVALNQLKVAGYGRERFAQRGGTNKVPGGSTMAGRPKSRQCRPRP